MTNHPNRSSTQAAQFRRIVIDNKPNSGGLNWRTVIQYATELGGRRDEAGDRFQFPDGSYAHVTGLHSGSPRVHLR
jgi:hypothetical protein